MDNWRETLGRHVLAHCLEAPNDDIVSYVPDEVDIEYDEWEIEDVRTDGSAVVVEAVQQGYETEQVSPTTWHSPAEYEQFEGTIIAVAHADWSDDPLAGDCSLELVWLGGAPSPPDPEPHGL